MLVTRTLLEEQDIFDGTQLFLHHKFLLILVYRVQGFEVFQEDVADVEIGIFGLLRLLCLLIISAGLICVDLALSMINYRIAVLGDLFFHGNCRLVLLS